MVCLFVLIFLQWLLSKRFSFFWIMALYFILFFCLLFSLTITTIAHYSHLQKVIEYHEQLALALQTDKCFPMVLIGLKAGIKRYNICKCISTSNFLTLRDIKYSPLPSPLSPSPSKDLENEREIPQEEAKGLAKKYGIPYMECSAKRDGSFERFVGVKGC